MPARTTNNDRVRMADLGYWSALAPLGAVELVPLRLDIPGLGSSIVAAPWIMGDRRTDKPGDCLSPFPRRTESMFRWILRGDGSPRGGCLLLATGWGKESSPFIRPPSGCIGDALVSIVPDSSWKIMRKHHLNNLQLEYSLRTQPVSWTSLLNEGEQFVTRVWTTL